MTPAEYLASPEAERDIARALDICGQGLRVWLDHLDVYAAEAWTVLDTLARPAGRVYFRQLQPGDAPLASPNFVGWAESPYGHYAVTDLGEGSRALKLRTGAMEGGEALWDPVSKAAFDVLGEHMADGRVVWTWNGGDLYMPAVAPADLPRALCRVLLAAHRVASLETG